MSDRKFYAMLAIAGAAAMWPIFHLNVWFIQWATR